MMNALLRICRAIDRLSEQAARIADWLVLAASLVSAGNAAMRYLLSYSSNAWLEIQWYMFAAMVFLGASYTLRRNEHVRVDIFYSSVSDRTRLWIDAFGFLFVLIPVGIYVTILSFPFFWSSYLVGETSSNAGGLLLWPIKIVLPLGFALLTLQAVSELIKRILVLSGNIDLDTHYERPTQ